MQNTLKRADTMLMAFCTAFIVANIYYCQPLVILVAKDFGLSESSAGSITFLTQAGYAIGLFVLVPLGDMFEKRRQILITTFIAIVALLIAGFAKNFLTLQIASVLIGAFSIVPQLILPLTASLSNEHDRGHNIGIVMSGLLIGILASRAVAGTVGDLLGWRAMFLIAALICLVMMILMRWRFPKSLPSFTGTYRELLKTMFGYVKSQSVLRETSLINFFAFIVIMGFWTTMVLYLANPPHQYSAYKIGLFGILGAAGALAAPLVGKLGGRGNPRKNLMIGFILELISLVLFLVSDYSIFLFIIGVILIDIGQQAIHVTNQTRIYSLIPEARNRLNTIFMTVSFIGASCGSALGIWLWSLGGWYLFCSGLIGVIILNIGIYQYYKKHF